MELKHANAVESDDEAAAVLRDNEDGTAALDASLTTVRTRVFGDDAVSIGHYGIVVLCSLVG